MYTLSDIGFCIKNYFYQKSKKELMTNTKMNFEHFMNNQHKYRKCWAKGIEKGEVIWKNKIDYVRILPKTSEIYEIELKHSDYSSTIVQTDKIYKKGATFILHMSEDKRIEIFSNYKKL